MCVCAFRCTFTVHVLYSNSSSFFTYMDGEPSFIFNAASRLQMMGQFKFGVLIKSVSLNLVHNICIIPTNYLQLCCERG